MIWLAYIVMAAILLFVLSYLGLSLVMIAGSMILVAVFLTAYDYVDRKDEP
jgi:hypothetical protein